MKTLDLKSLRKDKRMTQKELSAILKVPQSFISQVESGKAPMPAHWEDILREHFKISDLSIYQKDMDKEIPYNNVNAKPFSSFNDMEVVITVLKSQLDTYTSIIKEKDEQIKKRDEHIGRLLSLVENMQGLNQTK